MKTLLNISWNILRGQLIAITLLFLFPIHSTFGQNHPQHSELGLPVELNDGWTIGNLTESRISPEPLLELIEEIQADTFPDVHSVLIAHKGKLVFESYFPGYTFDYEGKDFRGSWIEFGSETLHNVASVTKSITGILVGIAIDQNCLPDLDASVFSFFPEHGYLTDEGKSKITLAHLLTMTSGLEWNEQDIFYSELENDIVQLAIVDDPVAYVLSKPLVNQPASTFYYNGGGPIVLGEIIQRCSDKRLEQFAEEHLFHPLQIHEMKWKRLTPTIYDAAGGIQLHPRDMAKIGQLVLNKGTWNGTRIVSESWIGMMTRRWVPLGPVMGYGFFWWTQEYPNGDNIINTVRADGWGGQRIMIFPDFDLVVVFTGGNYTQQHRLDEAVSRYILPSLNSSHGN